MNHKKYVIGVDFGTQSGRAVLVEVGTGALVSQAVKEYTHGVMDEYLWGGGQKLGQDWALQHPQDYMEVLETVIPMVLQEGKVPKEAVIGLASDFTSCTILPVDQENQPLCFHEEFRDRPHAYVKLWKHHAAQEQACRVTKLAVRRQEPFLGRYGGIISSEWLLPKVMQIVEEDQALYQAVDQFAEVADWLNWTLTGVRKRSSCTAGYKEMWSRQEGFPAASFLAQLDPRLADLNDKLQGEVCSLGEKHGELVEEMAERIGLCAGTPVGISVIDAHAAVPGSGITGPNQLLMIMGTSTCHILMSEEEKHVPGICGCVEDGILPGYWAYEAGQACVGDHFDWFTRQGIPADYQEEANRKGLEIQELLTQKAELLKPGESGLLALDWWNGNRSPLVDYDLTGMILGMTLTTKPEEIYRALIEATAYGTNWIIENYEQAGIRIDQIFACGGIASKNAMLMQVYADVSGRKIRIAKSMQTSAMGAAIFAAVAAGEERGGYASVFEAIGAMSGEPQQQYIPNPENHRTYQRLYQEYRKLAAYFGEGPNKIMKTLKELRRC